MARFSGKVGYAESVEKSPGIFADVMTERHYQGDLLRNVRDLVQREYLNKEVTTNNSVSVTADAYAREHFHAIRYVKWAGVYWTVTEVEVNSPRLLMRLGGVYNGPRAEPA